MALASDCGHLSDQGSAMASFLRQADLSALHNSGSALVTPTSITT